MDGSQHLIGLGKIVGNLHSLELAVRAFLCEEAGENMGFPSFALGLGPLTHLTNFMSLGELIKTYNSKLTASERAFIVDDSVVTIRDAIAHGRLTTLSRDFPLTLYRFAKPQAGGVPIEFVDVVSEQWLDQKRQLIFDQIEKIPQCAKMRGYKLI